MNKIKFFEESILLFLIFVFSITGAFMLGFIAHKEQIAPNISTQALENPPKYDISFVFASKNGKNYYYPWCKGGSNIKKSNLVYFKHYKDAESQGFTLSRSCQENQRKR